MKRWIKNIIYSHGVVICMVGLFACESEPVNSISEKEAKDKLVVFDVSLLNNGDRSFLSPDTTSANPEYKIPSQKKAILFYHGSDGIVHSFITELYPTNDGFITDQLSYEVPDPTLLTLTRFIIVDGESPSIYYSSIKNDSEEGLKTEGNGCLPISLALSETADLDTCRFLISLIDVTKTIPQACGYKGWGDDCFHSFEIAYSVNICGDPCELLNGDIQKNHAIADTEMKIERQELKDGEWTTVGEAKRCKSGEGQLGVISLDNYLFLSDLDERYILTLILENEVEIMAAITMQDLLIPSQSGFWETPAGGADCTGYIHLDLCDIDLTQKSLINKNAKWAFEVTKPKQCIDK